MEREDWEVRFSAGLMFRIRNTLPLRAEAAYGEAFIPDRFETHFWVAGLTAEKEF